MKLIPNKKQRGFTLIEILVSLVVLAIGLLGLAGLQAAGLRNNNSAYHRSQATLLANDIIDKMRVNGGEALAPARNYNIALGAAPAGNPDCEGGTCTTAVMAAYDLNQWLCSLGNFDANASCTNLGITGLLPSGDGGVTVGAINAVTGSAPVTVQVRWADQRNGNTVTVTVNTQISPF